MMTARESKKILGIDYGAKNIGIAVSDEGGKLAFPKCILKNNSNLLNNITNIAEEENINFIVIGESTAYSGRDNPVMKGIRKLKKELEKKLHFLVHLEPEYLTTAEARRLQDSDIDLDASAAALILQRYLDKQ